MARMICYTIVALLLLSFSTFSVDVNEVYNYILLITDVHNYYGTTCIVIVHSDSCTDFNETSLAYVWSRALSKQGILSTIVSFSELPSHEVKKHQGYIISRPLYVIVLTTKETMAEFSTVTKRIDVSVFVWLVMFLPYGGNPMRDACRNPVGNPFNVRFNTEMLVLCYDLPDLEEWYALPNDQTRVFNLATWKLGQGLSFRTGLALYARRNNLFGEKIRISIVKVDEDMEIEIHPRSKFKEIARFELKESLFIEEKDGVLLRFFGGVIRELSKSMNFTIDVISFMSAYGNWDEANHAWTGVIGEVASNRADFGVAEFSMTNHRLDAVDFTFPLILSRNKIYFKKPDGSHVQWSAYFKTFHMNIWMAIIFLILSTPILLTVMKTRGRVAMQVLADNYIHVWGIYCQQSLSEFPSESSLRLAFLSIFVSALIVLSAYSAALISFLTVSTVTLPFSNIEQFVAYGSYQLIVFKDSSDYDMINSLNDSVFLKLKKMLKENHDLPSTAYDAFTQVCNEKVGFYVTEAIKNAMGSLPCETVYIEADKIDSLALVLNKGSQYTGVVNYHLQRFKDNGILGRLRTKHLVTISSNGKGFATVTLGGIAPILTVLAGGVFLGCFVLMLEKVYYDLCSKCNKGKETLQVAVRRKFVDGQFDAISKERRDEIERLQKIYFRGNHDRESSRFLNAIRREFIGPRT